MRKLFKMKRLLVCILSFVLVFGCFTINTFAATFGIKMTVPMSQSTPSGWVTISYNAAFQTKVIEGIDDAPYGETITVPTSESTPSGWITMGYNAAFQTKVIKCIKNAPYSTTLTVPMSESVPSGWTIISYNTAFQTKVIKCLSGTSAINYAINKDIFSFTDTFTINVATYPPLANQSVYIKIWRIVNGVYTVYSDYGYIYGTTDSSGNWNMSGTFSSDLTGHWIEQVRIGNSYSNLIHFTVQ